MSTPSRGIHRTHNGLSNAIRLEAPQTPEAVRTYREEREAAKARQRAGEVAKWAEIDALWQRQLELDRAAQKGGRPGSKRNSRGFA